MVNLISNQFDVPVEVTKCAGWQGKVTIAQIEKCLTGHPVDTYALSLGNTTLFLSYVAQTGKVKNISVEKEQNEWLHQNGTVFRTDSLEKLIEGLMKCKNPIPLKASFI